MTVAERRARLERARAQRREAWDRLAPAERERAILAGWLLMGLPDPRPPRRDSAPGA